MADRYDVAIVGGCGRIGLPLGLAFADAGLRVALLDRRADLVGCVNVGRLPYAEAGAAELLTRALARESIAATTDPAVVGAAEDVVIVVGTPADDDDQDGSSVVCGAIEALCHHFHDGQLLVLRSTVAPGVTAQVEQLLCRRGLDVDVAFCPERVVEGHALAELATLPALVGARGERAAHRAAALISHIASEVVHLEPEEAELAKLFANAWRYIEFAAANQFFMIANDLGLDYTRIRDAIRFNYPRGAELPAAGFVGGPCLAHDTMRLAAAHPHFGLGDASLRINAGLPAYVVEQMERSLVLADLTVGILGMAFKAESDDIRSSLSYDLKRLLKSRARDVLCTDPYVTTDPELVMLDHVLARADVLVIGAPHECYAGLTTELPIVDIWH
jgi:UDP-N-acetyl-D-mannosaminuronic acid dehydrogenase